MAIRPSGLGSSSLATFFSSGFFSFFSGAFFFSASFFFSGGGFFSRGLGLGSGFFSGSGGFGVGSATFFGSGSGALGLASAWGSAAASRAAWASPAPAAEARSPRRRARRPRPRARSRCPRALRLSPRPRAPRSRQRSRRSASANRALRSARRGRRPGCRPARSSPSPLRRRYRPRRDGTRALPEARAERGCWLRASWQNVPLTGARVSRPVAGKVASPSGPGNAAIRGETRRIVTVCLGRAEVDARRRRYGRSLRTGFDDGVPMLGDLLRRPRLLAFAEATPRLGHLEGVHAATAHREHVAGAILAELGR